MKVLFPVDGSDYTKRMLAYVAVHDELVGSANEHVFLTVVAALPMLAQQQLAPAVIESFYAVEAEQVFKSIRAFAEQQRWPMRLETGRGHAASVIAEFVEREKPDLIVMGSHGHGVLGNAMLGSVAAGVLARCRTPLLLIR